MKTIRQKAVDIQGLKLSPEEGFVLSRVDGATTVKELVALTGFDEDRVVGIVGRLSEEGALEVEGAVAPTRAPCSAVEESRAREGSSDASALEAELLAFLRGDPEPEADAATSPVDVDTAADAATSPVDGEADDAKPESGALVASAAAAEPGEASSPATEEEDAAVRREQLGEREYRKIYETVYHPMTKDERARAATDAAGSHLLALCLDADPQVVIAVLANSRSGLDQARLVALHHRTHVGLEAVAKRSDFLADALVQRRLLRNPQLPGTILHRIVNPRMMMEVYKLAVDREIPERTRMMTRDVLRKKFMLSSSDERAALLFKTEGRCLVLLVNCSLDAHATQILCSKQTYTILFIQNLARWSATPPTLLAHLLKNPVVRRNPGLRKMLLKHPNTPSDAKRSQG